MSASNTVNSSSSSVKSGRYFVEYSAFGTPRPVAATLFRRPGTMEGLPFVDSAMLTGPVHGAAAVPRNLLSNPRQYHPSPYGGLVETIYDRPLSPAVRNLLRSTSYNTYLAELDQGNVAIDGSRSSCLWDMTDQQIREQSEGAVVRLDQDGPFGWFSTTQVDLAVLRPAIRVWQ